MQIGGIELPILSTFNLPRSRQNDEFVTYGSNDPVVVESKDSLRSGNLKGAIAKDEHSETKATALQREDMYALTGYSAGYNSIDTAGLTGYFSIISVEAPRDNPVDSKGSVTLQGRFLPGAKYQRADKKPIDGQVSNDFGLEVPLTVALPVGASNLRLNSSKTGDEINVSSLTTVATEDGDVPLVRLFPFWEAEGMATQTGTTSELDTSASDIQVARLDSSGDLVKDTMEVGADIPTGNYTVKVRLKDSAQATDDAQVTVNNDTDSSQILQETTTATGSLAVYETSEFDLGSDDDGDTISVEVQKATGTTNNLDIDEVWIEPAYNPYLRFDLSTHVEDGAGEVKLYDDNNSSTESDWGRVFDAGHSYTGAPVLENGLIQLRVKDAGDGDKLHLYWRDTGAGSWVDAGRVKHSTQADGADETVDTFNLVSVSPEEVEVEVSFHNKYYDTLTIGRGDPFMRCGVDTANRFFISTAAGSNQADNGFIPATSVSGGIDTVAESDPVDNWLIGFESSTDVLYLGAAQDDENFFRFTSGGNITPLLDTTGDESNTVFLGAIPLQTGSVSNLFKDAANATLSSGAASNHFEDDYSNDSSGEHTQEAGTWTFNTTDERLESADQSGNQLIVLDSLEWGNGDFEADVTIASGASNQGNGGTVFGYQDSSNYYWAAIRNDTQEVEIRKISSSGGKTAQSSFSISPGTTYNLLVDWDPSTGSIDLYIDDSTKSGSPEVSMTDTEFSSGKFGFRVFSSQTFFDNTKIDADETLAKNNSAVLMGGTHHGGGTGVDEANYYSLTPGTDIPLGTYYAVTRVKTTDPGNESASMEVRNTTDGSNVDLDGNAQYEVLTVTSSYTYFIREIELTSDDDGDTIKIGVREDGADTAPVIAVDFFVLFPVALADDMGPQDVAHRALEASEQGRSLLQRRN